MGNKREYNYLMYGYGASLSEELKIKFDLSDYAARLIAVGINESIKKGILHDSKYRYPSGVKRRSKRGKVIKSIMPEPKKDPINFTPDNKAEVIEMEKLRDELKGITKDHFHGRVYTQETNAKIQRLIELENKLKK